MLSIDDSRESSTNVAPAHLQARTSGTQACCSQPERLRGTSEFERTELQAAAAKDRGKYYNEAIFWLDFSEAESAQRIFHNYLVENRIFMTADLREEFSAVEHALSTSLGRASDWD